LTGEFPSEVVYLRDTLEILDIGSNLVYSNATEFNPYLGQLLELVDLRTDKTNFQSIDGIPTEIGNLKKLGYYACEGSLYEGPLNGAAFPSDMTSLCECPSEKVVTVIETRVKSNSNTVFPSRFGYTAVLDIEANRYSSPVPTEIGFLPALQNLYLRASDIRGDLNYMTNMQSICT